jgi:hypothetical protein
MRRLRKNAALLVVVSILFSFIWYVVVSPAFGILEFLGWIFFFLFIPTFPVFLIIDRSHAQFHAVMGYGILNSLTNLWIMLMFYSPCCNQLSRMIAFANILVSVVIVYYGKKGIDAGI